MSQTPLPFVGMNSMYRVKDTGTPPRPRPTQNRKKTSHYSRKVILLYIIVSCMVACIGVDSQCLPFAFMFHVIGTVWGPADRVVFV